jgi:VanZ family protein
MKKKGVLFVLWSLLILIIMGIPGNYFPQPVPFIRLFSPDKIVHLILFAPFAYLLLKDLSSTKHTKKQRKKLYVITFVNGTVYAIMTELLQFFVFVGRNGNYVDAIADIIGILLGIGVFWLKEKRKKSIHPN